MNFNEYQEKARRTAIYPGKDSNYIYPTLGLVGEAGEVAEKVKKIIRDENGIVSREKKEEIKKELGDVLWYIANLAYELDIKLEEIAQGNIEKIFSRVERNKVHGDGDEIIKIAKEKNITFCLPIEKSGQEILKLAYKDLNEINKIRPDYIKLLIRYNPLNIEVNKKQISVLKKVNDFCLKNNYKILLELLVPQAKEDLLLEKDFDKHIRLDRTCQAINEIQEYIKVHIWKLEGFTKKGWYEISKLTDSKIIFLGRGESKAIVKKWLLNSKNIENIIGFAIGRTIFLESLEKYSKNLITKEQAIQEIENNYKYFINLADK
jgi:myo-inositol catabolism protein IolC